VLCGKFFFMKFSRFFKCQICGLSLLAVAACSSSRKLTKSELDHFVTSPVVVDGDDSEWPNPYPHYDSKAMLSYAVSNDHDNLYISVKANDPMIERKLLVGGLTVWIDPTGKKEELLAIQYPQKGSVQAYSQERHHPTNDGSSEDQRPINRDSTTHQHHEMHMPADMSLIGFSKCDGPVKVNSTNGCGIVVRMNTDSWNELIWEAAIPFTALYNGAAAAHTGGKTVSICLEAGAMPMPARDGQGGGHGGGGGMGGGMHGGGMHGGMGGGGMGMGMGGGGGHHGGGGGQGGYNSEDAEKRELLSKKTETWIQARIAAQ
jgi:hypothetical protein